MSDRKDKMEPSISSVYRLGDEVLFAIFNAQPIEIGNHIPITLQDSESLWIVHKGTVDVFVVRVDGSTVVSQRTHLFRAKEGQAIFGLDLALFEGKLALIAVGSQNATVSQIERAKFESTLISPLTSKPASKLLDGWIRNFSQSILQDLNVHQVLPLEAGQEFTLKTDEVSRPKREVVWVSVQTGMVQFVSRAEIPLLTGGDFLPLCDKTWIRAHRDSKVRILSTEQFITAGFTWEHVTRFHTMILNSILWNVETADEIELERLKQRREQDNQRVDNALRALSEILTRQEDDLVLRAVTNEDDEDEILVAACRIVGNALGVKIQTRPDPIDGRQEKQTLDSIIRISGLRMRQVILRNDWWRQDNGPLLAFMETDKRPVALVPVGTSDYMLHDPTLRAKQRVKARTAHQIAPTAYQFYRTLPNKGLDARDLLQFGLAGARRDLAIVAVMGVFVGILGMITPLVIGRIFDTIIPGSDRSQLAQFTLLILAAAIGSALFLIVQNLAVLRVEMRLDSNLQSAIWDRLLMLPTPFFRDFTAGDLASRTMGANMIRRRVSGAVVLSVLTSVFSLFNFVLLFLFSPTLALLATGIVFVAFLVSLYAGYNKMRYERELADIEGFISGMVFQFIIGISKFRVAGVENRAFSEWAKHFTQQKRYAYYAGVVNNWLEVFNSIYPVLAAMAIFTVALSSTDLTTGEFLAFYAAFTQFLLATLTLSSALISVLEIVPTYERMKPILQTLPEVDETKSDPGKLAGEIEVSRLSFRYDKEGPLILTDVSIHINPGEFVAIVGPSGSGKSTLFRLLLGFEKPEAGSIFYDGQDLAKLDITAVRQQLGVVLQNGQLMTGDMFSNIVGVAALTLDDAWSAAAMAGLKKDIEEMPMGMHTIISEGGSTLSGGQRQRLLIARAIARKPKILYFDEATSALDNQTQSIVSESLENLDATRVVIAHRLSTIINADQILVLDKGRVAQQGTYNDLIRQPGVFQDLAKRQLI